MKVFLTAVLALAALSSGSIVKPSADNFELLILHNNDMHARFEQTSQLSGACTTEDREAGKCYGGFPRVAHVVKEARKQALNGEGPPVLYLNAGDTYTGTAWFTIYKWKIAAEFVNALQPDAVSLGNNEVDEASKVSPLLENINVPILATNVIIKSAAEMTNVHKSIIFNIKDVQVGVVGYLTPESGILDSSGNVEYINEVLALTEEVEKLQALNVNIIIALGHSTRAKDIEIAREVAGLDMVITGNKNTFFWNGDTVSNAEDSLLVTQQSGRTVPVILSTAYNKYLGSVHIKFDADGEIAEYDDNRILLDSSIPQDTTSLDIIKKYTDLTSRSEEVLGNTAVKLDAKSCAVEECNFGNFVTDAIMYYYATRFQGDTWTDAPIAIIHSGALGDSIAPANRPAAVTRGDVLSALPVESNLVTVTMTGSVLNQVLEHAVADYNQGNPTGEFLQFSGIRVEYDFEKDPGSRVVNAVVRCWNCFVPEFYVIDDWRDYKVLMPAALANGEYGYSMLVGLPRSDLAYDEVTCTSEYIQQRSPVYPEVAGRIVLHNRVEHDSAAPISSSLFIVIVMSIVSNIYNCLGNHDFDDGISGLLPFIRNLTCPVLAANLDLTKVPELQAESNLFNSVLLDINGTKIGVIGYLTPDTKKIAVKNDVEYIEEVTAIEKEAAELKAKGVNILIALGHSGYLKDLEIAKKIKDLDLVIGGHSHTFLWNGTNPDAENAQGLYPTMVKEDSGRTVPVVQAYAYTKYLGKIHLIFDSNGNLVHVDGQPILLDNSIPQDPDVLEIVQDYSKKIQQYTERTTGVTSVNLDGLSCRLKECNMGNLIAEAMIHKYVSDYGNNSLFDAPVAVINSGSIRVSLAYMRLPANLTYGDLMQVLPFEQHLIKISINGSVIKLMFEHSVDKYDPLHAGGQFLQVSGIKVVYDFEQPPGKRVENVYMRCGECSEFGYSILDMTKTYDVLVPHFMAMGGDGYSFLPELPSTSLDFNPLEATVEYLTSYSPVNPSVEGRITIKNIEKYNKSHF